MPEYHSKEIKILSSDCDRFQHLRLSKLFSILQEISIADVERIGLTRDKTLDKGMLWVISRMRLEMERPICYDETITISTIAGKRAHMMFPRYYEVRDSEGSLILRGSAIWLLIYADSRTPIVPEEEQIEMEKTESPERIEKSKGRLFPTRGGVLRTMDCASDRYEYLAVDGVENIMRMAEDIRAGRIHHCFIEMSACEGSCVNGPVSVKKNQSIAGGTIAVNQFAGKRDFDCYHVQPDEIGCAYEDDHRHRVMPSEELIQKTLVKMHKEDPASRLNCGSCGYDSCREKAVAIIRGRANPDMCLPLMMEKAASMSDKIVSNSTNGLMVLDDNLHIQLINDRMCRMLGGLKSAELIGQQVTAILDPFDYLDALNGEHVRARKQHLEQYGKWVENTVIYDQKFNVLICIMRDITKQEEDALKQKKLVEQTLMVADEVLNNNMMTVHEIASLLGETAAQTKVALTTLKETIKND